MISRKIHTIIACLLLSAASAHAHESSSLDRDKTAETWFSYSGTWTGERFSISFPNQNEVVESDGKVLSVSTGDNSGVVYQLAIRAHGGEINPMELLENCAEDFKETGEIINISYSEYLGFPVMDTYLFDLSSGAFHKIRTLVTSKNLYFALTIFTEDMDEQHSTFIRSLLIHKKRAD